MAVDRRRRDAGRVDDVPARAAVTKGQRPRGTAIRERRCEDVARQRRTGRHPHRPPLAYLRVMARGTVFDSRKLGPAAAGKALGVSTVVTGQWRTEGDTYHIHVELIDVQIGRASGRERV